jgi:hypothetical protein
VVSPRVREESVHPRLQSGVSGRPLNFTVRSHGGDIGRFGVGSDMTPWSYRVHLWIGVGFLVALLFSVANDILRLGFFGRSASAVSAATILLFLIYGAFFMPRRQELRQYLDARRLARRRDAQ